MYAAAFRLQICLVCLVCDILLVIMELLLVRVMDDDLEGVIDNAACG